MHARHSEDSSVTEVSLASSHDCKLLLQQWSLVWTRRQQQSCLRARLCAWSHSQVRQLHTVSAASLIEPLVSLTCAVCAALEWPAVCRQVAAFPELRRSALQILSTGLDFGSTQVQLTCMHAAAWQTAWVPVGHM